MEKVIKIDGRDVGFKATALTPRLYRHRMGRDIIQDLNKLKKAYNKALSLPDTATDEEKEDAQLSSLDLEIFENVAYIMARQYDRITLRTGFMSLRRFQFMRSFQASLSFGL